jgi:hypothetical protein
MFFINLFYNFVTFIDITVITVIVVVVTAAAPPAAVV